jgi:PAS domain S-box-containing protein
MTFKGKAAPSCIMVISDISEIKSMSNVLSERENLLLDIADSVPVLMWLTNANGDCIYFNRAWYEFTGRTFEQERAKGWMNGIHRKDFNDFFRIFREGLGKKQRFECEFRLKESKGQHRWGLFCGEPHFSPDGIFEGLIGNFMDITKRKNMEKERRDTEIKIMAQGKLAAMGEIAASVVHEISQPLAFINANLQMLISQMQSEDSNPESLLEDLKNTENAAKRIGKIISHMSNFGRHEDFDLEHPANINNVIDNALMLLNNKLMLRSVSLKRKIPDNLPMVRCNPLKLEQIFINLFQNSIDACKEEVDASICISARKDKKNIVISFSDNGEGIPPAHKKKIFEAFFTTKQNGKGTGLGLLIIKRLVEECGGGVRCESKGKGAKFIIKLPVA